MSRATTPFYGEVNYSTERLTNVPRIPAQPGRLVSSRARIQTQAGIPEHVLFSMVPEDAKWVSLYSKPTHTPECLSIHTYMHTVIKPSVTYLAL